MSEPLQPTAKAEVKSPPEVKEGTKVEQPKQPVIGATEQSIVNRIDQDGEPDETFQEIYEVPTKEVVPILDETTEQAFENPIESKHFKAFLGTLEAPHTPEEEQQAKERWYLATTEEERDILERDNNLIIRELLPQVNNNIYNSLEYYHENFDEEEVARALKSEFGFEGSKEEFVKLANDILTILRFEAPRPDDATPDYETRLALLTTTYFTNVTNRDPTDIGSRIETEYHRRYKEGLRMTMTAVSDSAIESKGYPVDIGPAYHKLVEQAALLDKTLIKKYGFRQNFNTLEQFARRVDPEYYEEKDRRSGKDEREIVEEVVEREKEDQILGLVTPEENAARKTPTPARQKVAV